MHPQPILASLTSTTPPPAPRPAVDADGDALARLIAACFAEYPGCRFDRAREFPELDAIARHFAAIDGSLWVADGADGLAGSLGARPLEPGTVELVKVYVDARWRGSGLASRLLAQGLAFARARGAVTVELWSDTRFTRAHAFYRKHGFRSTGEARFVGDLSASWEARFVRGAAA